MKQIFDWLREQITKCLEYNKTCENEFRDSNMTFIYKGQINTWKMALAMVDEAEAKWEADCCVWEGFDNSLTKGKIEWTYKITCQNQPRYILEDYTDGLWTRCPYCGKIIKTSEVE